ncbi:MAG TPA: WecB/TagA/CpsF family glycosyltransferase [Actinomycetales bacterium]|jgi:N-acetylglucosaminyldiphosphoundecaprenol N-acetyl-beta-D-mannosaminyltransferase
MTQERPSTARAGTGDFAGVPVTRTTLSEACEEVIRTAKGDGSPTAFRLVNSYTFALADQMRPYHHLLRHHGVNFPDGRPLVQSLNALVPGAHDFEQVRGPSLFVECLDRGREHDVRHYFLGGTEQLLEALISECHRVFPGITICGSYSPAFRELTDDERAEQDAAILSTSPDIIWVGLGTPKQDFEAQRLTDAHDVTTAGVGAAFAFLAGAQLEAPQWLRDHSLEWCFRLWSEPRRLWRRYLFGNSRFVYLVVRSKFRPRLYPASPPRSWV